MDAGGKMNTYNNAEQVRANLELIADLYLSETWDMEDVLEQAMVVVVPEDDPILATQNRRLGEQLARDGYAVHYHEVSAASHIATPDPERAQASILKLFVEWLHDAYAIEREITESLERQVYLAQDYPAVQSGIERYLHATRRHVETITDCLESLNESPSSAETAMASLGGKVQGMMPSAAKDALLKAAMQNYSAAHMGIASYKSLIVTANELGYADIAQELRGILEEEYAMARWLDESMPTLTRATVLQWQTREV